MFFFRVRNWKGGGVGALFGIISVKTHSYDVDERGLPGVLQAHQSKLHLLLPEQALYPFDDSVYKSQHFVFLTLPR